jgi:cation diffusion facilitator family transporter
MDNEYVVGKKVFFTTIFINILLTILKIIIGLISNSTALIADGIHSLSDIFTSVIGVIGLKLSSKKADDDHPYGHEKIEPIITKLMAIILLITGLFIGANALNKIISHSYFIPEVSAIYAVIISIATKEWMYHYTANKAKLIQSSSLLADAWHHRSDSLSSVGALVGLIFSKLGYPVFDPIASIIICAIIIKVALDIYIQAAKQLVDHSCDKETENKIVETILSVEGVKEIDVLKTRMHANKLFIDVECSLDKNLSFEEAHFIAEKIHITIEKRQKNVKHCMVHVNPK